VREWETLSAGRRDAATLALFVIATILDDVRFLQWAVCRVQDLAAEFAFVPGTSSIEASGLEESPDGGDAMAKWKEICGEISRIADRMGGDPPQLRFLEAEEDDESPVKQCSEQVLAQWRLAYRGDGDRDTEALRQDTERIERELKHALSRRPKQRRPAERRPERPQRRNRRSGRTLVTMLGVG